MFIHFLLFQASDFNDYSGKEGSSTNDVTPNSTNSASFPNRLSTPAMVETMFNIFVISGLTFIVTLGLAYICRCLCTLNCKKTNQESVSKPERRSTIDTGAGSESGPSSVTASAQNIRQSPEVRVVSEMRPQRQARPRSVATSTPSKQRATFYAAASTSSDESLSFSGDRKRLSLEIKTLSMEIDQLKLKKAQLLKVKGKWGTEIFV